MVHTVLRWVTNVARPGHEFAAQQRAPSNASLVELIEEAWLKTDHYAVQRSPAGASVTFWVIKSRERQCP